ncbi:MAG TPA: glycosyltransferase family 2 protein [Solirubrobacteraceae bacterium]|nr:glycosyltransferase family 2 protein [Solirubrobacteraceae bacterium]
MPAGSQAPPPSPSRAEQRVDISVLIPVLNEERHIRETVAAMQAQRFDGNVELLFADGGSEDATREILRELSRQDPRIRVLDNPRKRTASGLNVCLREARGEYVARMDAHTYYADRYLAAGVERLRAGGTEWVSGPAVPRPTGPISRAVALALASFLGRGGSRKWSEDEGGGEERELDTGVFGGVWRRETLLAAGGWDERWPINQDSEMASRFLRRGARLVCLPEMVGNYVPRDTFSGLVRQYFRYGYYRARTARRHPESLRRSHLIAPALSVALLGTLLAPTRPLRRLCRAGVGSYLAAVAATAASVARKPDQREEGLLLLGVLPVMHLGWGFGTLAGAAKFGPPFAALARLLGRGGAEPDPHPGLDPGAGALSAAALRDAADGVHAPSLHEQQA